MPSITINIQHFNQKTTDTRITEQITIGRRDQVPVDLNLSGDLKVSRLHARLYHHSGTWYIEDLRSPEKQRKAPIKINGQSWKAPVSLMPGDVLHIGDTLLTIEFVPETNNLDDGMLETQFSATETQLLDEISEDFWLDTFATITEIVSQWPTQQAMLEGILLQLRQKFPANKVRLTVLIQSDRELLPVVYWPLDHAYASFSLARRASEKKEAFHWVRRTNIGESQVPSVDDALEALYAPIINNGNVIGVLHVDTPFPEMSFTKQDLKFMGVVGAILGVALAKAGSETVSRLPSAFISYAHKDRAFVKRLASDLRRHQIKVWFDEHIQIGEKWLNRLALSIQMTDAFIFLVSPASLASKPVQWEIETARLKGKPILPLLYQDSVLPDWLAEIQYNHIGRNYDTGLRQLVEELKELPSIRGPSEKFKSVEQIRVLFLPVNTHDIDVLKLDQEARAIAQRLQIAGIDDIFNLRTHWALLSTNLSQYLSHYSPHIVHFVGRPNMNVRHLIEGNQAAHADALGEVFRIVNTNIRCIVLNACFSKEQAEDLIRYTRCVINVSTEIDSEAMLAFASELYRALGTGENMQRAVDLACHEIALSVPSDAEMPIIMTHSGINASEIVLIDSPRQL